MSAIDRGFDSLSLSDSLREALRRRMRELTGVALIVFAMLLVSALGSWSVLDPSLSHATNAPARNLLGVPGAIVADLMMQLFGIASVALVLPIAVWGWRLAGHRALYRERLRLLTWVAAVVLTASFAIASTRASSSVSRSRSASVSPAARSSARSAAFASRISPLRSPSSSASRSRAASFVSVAAIASSRDACLAEAQISATVRVAVAMPTG